MMKFTDSLTFKIGFFAVGFGTVIGGLLIWLSLQISSNLNASNEQIKLVQKQETSAQNQVKLIAEQKIELAHQQKLNLAHKSYMNMRTWLYDLQVSRLSESEDNADDAQQTLETHLDGLSTTDPEAVASLKPKVDNMYGFMIEAVDAYSAEDRDKGNALVSKARDTSQEIDLIFDAALAKAAASVEAKASEV
ncbi:MAG: hypothetical protein ACI8WB_002190 [Phenylobacterium sp.]|jgi:hypothetical protein